MTPAWGVGSARAGSWCVAAALAAAACGGAPTNPLSPAAPSTATLCRNLGPPETTTFDAVGGVVSAFIAVPFGCRWVAEASGTTSWAVVQNAGPHIGPAAVTLQLEPNRAFDGRLGGLLLRDDQGGLQPVHHLKQRAATCLYALSPSSIVSGSLGTWDGSGDTPIQIRVTAQPATCQWTATSTESWIHVANKSAQGTGDRWIYVTVSWSRPPTPTIREGRVTVAGLSGVNPDAVLHVVQVR